MCEFPRYQMLKTHAYKYNICDLPRYRTWTIQAWPTRRPFLPPSTSMPWHSTKWLSQLPASSSQSSSSSWWVSSFSSSPAWQRASGLWPQRLVCEIGRSLWIKSQNGYHWGQILMQCLSFLIDTDTLNIPLPSSLNIQMSNYFVLVHIFWVSGCEWFKHPIPESWWRWWTRRATVCHTGPCSRNMCTEWIGWWYGWYGTDQESILPPALPSLSPSVF